MDIKYPPLEAVEFVTVICAITKHKVCNILPRHCVEVSALQYGPTFHPVFAADLPYCFVDFVIQSRYVLLFFCGFTVEGIRCANNSTEFVTLKARRSWHPVQRGGGGGGCTIPDCIGSRSEQGDLPRSDGVAG